MLVFGKENLVFLAVPKTGTTALQNALAPRASMVIRHPPGLKHAGVYRYRRFLRPFLDQADRTPQEVMAVVREPIDWLGSWYRYRHRDAIIGSTNSTQGVSFDDFVTEYMSDKPAQFANVGSQANFLMTGTGELGVDHLFRYEAQKTLRSFLETRLSVTLEPKMMNVSPAMPLSLSPKVEAALRKNNAAEFAVWEMGQI